MPKGTELVQDDILGVCPALSPMHHSAGCLLSGALVRAEWCGPLFPAGSPRVPQIAGSPEPPRGGRACQTVLLPVKNNDNEPQKD